MPARLASWKDTPARESMVSFAERPAHEILDRSGLAGRVRIAASLDEAIG